MNSENKPEISEEIKIITTIDTRDFLDKNIVDKLENDSSRNIDSNYENFGSIF